MTRRSLTHQQWVAEAMSRYGSNPRDWKFVCPSCGYVASVKEWLEAGAEEEIATSCVGRALLSRKQIGDTTGGPCNYAGYGLLRLNPVEVIHPDGAVTQAFEFAPDEKKPGCRDPGSIEVRGDQSEATHIPTNKT